MTVVDVTINSISIRWEVTEEVQGSVEPSGYNVSYRNIEYTECFSIFNTTSISTASLNGQHTIGDLQEGTDYSITVSLLRDGVATNRKIVFQATAEDGKVACGCSLRGHWFIYPSQLHLPLPLL